MTDMAGRFWGVITTAVLCKAQNGSSQIAITFNVTHDGQGQELPNAFERRVFLSFSGGAKPYTEGKLKRLNFNGSYRQPQFAPADGGCWLDCQPHTYDGKTTMRWDLAPTGPGELDPVDNDVLRQLEAEWKAKNTPATRPAGRPAPAQKPTTNTPAPTAAPPVAEDQGEQGEQGEQAPPADENGPF